MNKPKLTIIEPFGYCEGVNFIISQLKQFKNDNDSFYIIDDLIHNNFFKEEIFDLNLIKVNTVNDIPANSTIIWPGHGHTIEEEKLANDLHLKQIDCTCPYLKGLFNRINNSKDKFIYYGKPEHRESKTFLSFDNVEPFDETNSVNEGLLINQSTIVPNYNNDILRRYKIINTTCPKVLERIKKFSEALNSNCFAIVCGHNNSSNCRTLFDVACNKIGKEKAALIESASDLDNLNLTNCLEIVLVSATSVPNKIVEQIINKIKSL